MLVYQPELQPIRRLYMYHGIWALVEKMVGNPDFAVCFSIWPWPDGGWMAGVVLLDREYAMKQKLPHAICALEEELDPAWNVTDGFRKGINIHAPHPEEAIQALY